MGLLDKLKKKDKEEKVDIKKSDNVEVAEKQDKKKVAPKADTKKTTKTSVANASFSHKVLLKPVISEKAATAEQSGKYTFAVKSDSNKYQVKEAIKETYGIMPKKVRIMNVEGKRTSFGRRTGKRSDWKKAIVELPKGKTINIHEGV